MERYRTTGTDKVAALADAAGNAARAAIRIHEDAAAMHDRLADRCEEQANRVTGEDARGLARLAAVQRQLARDARDRADVQRERCDQLRVIYRAEVTEPTTSQP